MFKACALVSFTSLFVVLSVCENYGYFNKVYSHFANQTAMAERLAAQSEARKLTMEAVERIAMALMVCVTGLFFWRDFSHYRTLFGQETKGEIGAKLVSMKKEIDKRLKNLEDKMDDFWMRHYLEDENCICLPSDAKPTLPIALSDERTEMQCNPAPASREHVQTLYSRPEGPEGQTSTTLTLTVSPTTTITTTQDAYRQTEPQELLLEKGSQTSCPRIDCRTESTRVVGVGDVSLKEPVSWYAVVKKEEEEEATAQGELRVPGGRTYRGHGVQYSNHPSVTGEARTSRPTTPRHPGPADGTETNRRRRQRNYNYKPGNVN